MDDHHYDGNREQRYPQEGLNFSQPTQPKPMSRDSHFSKSKSYSSYKDSANHKPDRGNARSSRSRYQEKSQSSKTENYHSRSPERSRKEPFYKVIQLKAKEKLPDHYDILEISRLATEGEIKSAVKRRRVEVHPDRLKKAGMSDVECTKIDALAAQVGEAADILSNPAQKEKYDRKWCAANAS